MSKDDRTLLRNVARFAEEAERMALGVEGLAVFSRGETIFERHWAADAARNTYSHTKSFLSAAVGIAIGEGKLSLDDRVIDCFPSAVPPQNRGRLSQVRLRHLLTMTSGFGKPLLMHDMRASADAPSDYVAFLCGRPLLYDAGSRFVYSTGDSILAGRMLEAKTGVSLDQYLFERLLRPLGVARPVWERCKQGHALGGGGMCLRLADMLKLGILYLQKGVWEGVRYLPQDWVYASTHRQTEIPASARSPWCGGYGYHFWLTPRENAFFAHGSFGQDTFVFPDAQTALSIQCAESGDEKRIFSALYRHVLSDLC